MKTKAARFLFKCRLCGEIDDSLDTGEARALPILIQCMNTGKSWNNDFPLKMVDVHHCADGNVGVADLIGYKIVNTWRKKA